MIQLGKPEIQKKYGKIPSSIAFRKRQANKRVFGRLLNSMPASPLPRLNFDAQDALPVIATICFQFLYTAFAFIPHLHWSLSFGMTARTTWADIFDPVHSWRYSSYKPKEVPIQITWDQYYKIMQFVNLLLVFHS